MAFNENLMNNKDFLMNTFVELINEEVNRIIVAKIATKNQLEQIISPLLKHAAPLNDDDKITSLSSTYNVLKKIFFSDDIKKVAEVLHIEIVPVEEAPVEVEDEEPEFQHDDYTNILNKLQKLLHELGSKGNHKAAYKIERMIKNFDK